MHSSLIRTRGILSSPQDAEVIYQQKKCYSFCSNDYLGLANHPDIIKAAKRAADHYGVGSGASHLITGHSDCHHLLEEELAEFIGAPRALLFSTGYMANLGVITTLMQKADGIFADRLSHASLLDASLASKAKLQRFLHNNPLSLKQQLENSEAKQKMIVTEGVFSMDGDIAPAPELLNIAKHQQAKLFIDEAHTIGVLGKHGRGSLEHHNIKYSDDMILMGTLGKAFGSFGAFVAGSESVIESLIQGARPYIYTTALPPMIAAAARAGLQLIKNETWRREHLNELITYFKTEAANLGLQLAPSITPIQPLLIGDSEKALEISHALLEQGILVKAIRPPTVPPNTARLRITFSANHTIEHVTKLLEGLKRVC